MSKIGLNADLVSAYGNSVESQLGILETAQNTVQSASLAAANPLSLVIAPGSQILNPMSIPQLLAASAEITLARGSARELLRKLGFEVQAQEFASEAGDLSYASGVAWRTPDNDRLPDVSPMDFFSPLQFLKDVADNVTTLYGYGENAFELAKRWAGPQVEKFTKWYDDLPGWAKGLKGFGKALPFVGSALSFVDLGIAIRDGDVPGIIQNGGSIAIDVITLIVAPTGIGIPIGIGVGVLWDVGWETYYNIDYAFKEPEKVVSYYQENPWMAAVHGIAPITTMFWGPFADK
jgi:hypothetical protein